MTVRFPPSDSPDVDPLLSFVTLRSVDRHPYRRRALSSPEKLALQACLPDGVTVDWHEGFGSLRAHCTPLRGGHGDTATLSGGIRCARAND